MRWTGPVIGLVALVGLGVGLGWLASDGDRAPRARRPSAPAVPVVLPQPIPVSMARGPRCQPELLMDAPGSVRAAIDDGSLVTNDRGVGFYKGLAIAPREDIGRMVSVDFGDGTVGTWNFEGHTSTGFMFQSVPEGGLSDALGFKVFDVIATIDQDPLVDNPTARAIWQARVDGPGVCVRYVRAGRFLVRYVVAADAVPAAAGDPHP
ncbi:MAG: hypothetical protein H6733_14220 [Alphaproteobacteria bacterium]|nr:hypothetical protein [Alphaproteobacteria bacterium]